MRIYTYERGQRGDALLASDSEQEICNHYYALVSQESFVLLMLSSKPAAQQVQALLATEKIESKLHALPAKIFGVTKYQVIVNGRDLGRARHTLSVFNGNVTEKMVAVLGLIQASK